MIDYNYLENLVRNMHWIELFVWHVIGFSLMYFLYSSIIFWLTTKYLPLKNIGKIIDTRPLRKDQIKKEIRQSMLTLIIQSFFGMLALKLDQYGYINMIWENCGWWVLFDIICFLLWNEFYFYSVHRLFHTKWLFKVSHLHHHWSLIPTPFTTFSFHWLESLAFGFTMLSTMAWKDYSILSIMIFPVFMFILNSIGHFNYALFPDRSLGSFLSSSWRHGLHHSRINGNYGFWLPNIDIVFKTRLKNVSYSKSLNEIEFDKLYR